VGKMNIDIITIILAIYAALLSTVLGVIEILKNTKQLDIVIKTGTHTGKTEIIILNNSVKPIVIIDISCILCLPKDRREGFMPLPKNAIFANIEDLAKFPFTLHEGESQIFVLGECITKEYNPFTKERRNLSFTLYDANGKQYSKVQYLTSNDRYGIVE
jgi:hypothetical protein